MDPSAESLRGPSTLEALLPQVQQELQRQGLAGWLLYDFRGSNPVAQRLLDFGGAMLTRRWFCFVSSSSKPVILVHAIEIESLCTLPYPCRSYGSRESLVIALDEIVPKAEVALEYSPEANIPYVSHVDAGTIDLLRSLGVTPVSSADLLQTFSVWSREQIKAHLAAVEHVVEAKDRAFAFIAEQLRKNKRVGELDVQGLIMDYFSSQGLETDHAPIIGFGVHSRDPHYSPTAQSEAVLKPNDVILIDLWAKLQGPQGTYADITWMGCYGQPLEHVVSAFDIVMKARDLAVSMVEASYKRGEHPRGFEVDAAVRELITHAGFGNHFTHRTGHSLGSLHLHGEGANLDNYETHDTRKLIPGLGVTVEPGIYLDSFGVRTEINLIMQEEGPWVTTPSQRELSILGAGKS